MALLLHSSSSPLLQDNIQLIIYSRAYSETLKKDIATMPPEGVGGNGVVRHAEKCRGEGSRSRGVAVRLGGRLCFESDFSCAPMVAMRSQRTGLVQNA